MMSCGAIVILGISFGVVLGQVPSRGGCPEVKTEPDFELDKYLGHWYEQERFYASFEAGQTCANANYSIKADGHIKVLNTGYDKSGKVVSATGDAYIADEKEPGKLKLRFSSFAPYGSYWVVDTDYDTYTLVYSCTSILSVEHLELAWILTRQKTLEPALKDKLFQKLASFGVDTSHFQTTDQTNCQAHL